MTLCDTSGQVGIVSSDQTTVGCSSLGTKVEVCVVKPSRLSCLTRASHWCLVQVILVQSTLVVELRGFKPLP